MIHDIHTFINQPLPRAGIAIASACDDNFKATWGAALNTISFYDEAATTCNGIWQGIQNRSFTPIRNIAGNSVQAAIAGTLLITGMLYSEVFKKVASTIAIAESIFKLNTDQGPGFSKKQELARLTINALSLAYELNPAPFLLAAKVVSQVAYSLFKSKYTAADTTQSFQEAAVGVITGIRGATKYVKLVEETRIAASRAEPVVPEASEHPILAEEKQALEIEESIPTEVILEEEVKEIEEIFVPVSPEEPIDVAPMSEPSVTLPAIEQPDPAPYSLPGARIHRSFKRK